MTAAGGGLAVVGAGTYALIQRAGMPSDEEISQAIPEAADSPAPAIVMQGTGIARGWSYRAGHPLEGQAIVRDSVMHSLAADPRVHGGLDIVGPLGTPVMAARAGVVLLGTGRNGYGRVVVLKHRGGVTTLYAHLNDIVVQPGQVVRGGQVIGFLGQSSDAQGGRTRFPTMGPHTHFSVHRGLPSALPSSGNERLYGTEPQAWLGTQGSRAILNQYSRT